MKVSKKQSKRRVKKVLTQYVLVSFRSRENYLPAANILKALPNTFRNHPRALVKCNTRKNAVFPSNAFRSENLILFNNLPERNCSNEKNSGKTIKNSKRGWNAPRFRPSTRNFTFASSVLFPP